MTRKLLDKAKTLIENNGWAQGYLICPNGYCILGALQQAAIELDSFEYCSAYHYVMDKIGAKNRLEIVKYNDDPGRTIEQVLEIFT